MYRYTTCIVCWWCVHVGASHAPLTKAAPGGGRWDRAGRGSSSAPFHGQASGRIDERFTDTVSCMMDGQRREMYLSFLHHQEGEKKRTKKRRTTPTCMQSRWRLEVCRMFGVIIRGVSAGVWSQVIRGRFALYIKWTFGTFYLFY